STSTTTRSCAACPAGVPARNAVTSGTSSTTSPRPRASATSAAASSISATTRRAGLVVARALRAMTDAAAPGVSTGELDALAREVLREAGATSSFLDYDIGNGPYPAVICASVND